MAGSYSVKAAARAVVLILLLAGCTSKKNQLQKAIVAEVNDSRLTTKEFADRLAIQLKQFDAVSVKDPTTLSRVKDQVLRRFIVESLIQQWGEKNKIALSQQDLDEEINRVRSNYPDDLSFRRALAAENLPLEEWTRRLRASLLERKVAKKLAEGLTKPSEEQVKQIYKAQQKEFELPERVRLKQIVVTNAGDAQRLYDEVRKNQETLGSLARKFSIAPESSQDGDTGWIEKGTLPIFDRAFVMPIGTLSPILKSPYGYHIYKVMAKQAATHLSLAQAQDSIVRRLSEEREQSMFSTWLEQQLKAAKIRRNETIISSLVIETKDH